MDLDLYLIQQLNNKFINKPVMINNLIVTDINDHHPQDFFSEELYGDRLKECYVLSPRDLLVGVPFRAIRQRNGYWKALECTDKICGVGGPGGVIGVKRIHCFFEDEFGKERTKNWNMVEYRLLSHYCSIECNHRTPTPDDWVLCKVYEDFDPDELTSQLDMMDIGEESYMET